MPEGDTTVTVTQDRVRVTHRSASGVETAWTVPAAAGHVIAATLPNFTVSAACPTRCPLECAAPCHEACVSRPGLTDSPDHTPEYCHLAAAARATDTTNPPNNP